MRASGALSFLILSLSLFFAIPSGLAQQTPAGKPKIAVFNLEPKKALPSDAEILSARLRGELVNSNAFIVVSREQMEKILGEQKMQLSGVTAKEDAVEAGKLLNAHKIVLGSLGRLGNTFTLDISVIDVASALIERSFKDDHRGTIDGLLKKIETIAREMAETLGYNPSSPYGGLSIRSAPSGATVLIDGEVLGETPATLRQIAVGAHVLVLRKQGYLSEKTNLIIESGKRQNLSIRLRKLYRVRIDSKPRVAEATINNKPLGTTPLSRVIPEGTKLEILLAAPGYQIWRKAFTLQNDMEITARLRPLVQAQKRPASKKWLWLAGGATAGVAAILLLSQRDRGEPGDKNLPAFPWPPERR